MRSEELSLLAQVSSNLEVWVSVVCILVGLVS